MITIVGLVAVAVFAVSGALAAAEQKLDILSFIFFGTITGVGGGTARDLLLGAGAPFWVEDSRYLWACISASMATWFFPPTKRTLHQVLLWADALGMSLFSVIGSIKALEYGSPPVVAVVLGMMTASLGSMIRDIFLGQRPVLLDPEIYVTAALLGSGSYVVLQNIPGMDYWALPVSVGLAFLLRGAAILFGIGLPKFSR